MSKNSLFEKISRVFKENYLTKNEFLTNLDIAKKIVGANQPSTIVGLVADAVERSMGYVRDDLEANGYLMIPNVEKKQRKISGRKLAKPEDAPWIVNELERRKNRRNGFEKPVVRAIDIVKEGNLLPMDDQSRFLGQGVGQIESA